MSGQCRADFYALWCDSCNLHPSKCPLPKSLTPARPDGEAVAWRWYRDGVIVPITEEHARHVFDRWQVLSDDRGGAMLMIEQLWAEIDRLRASPPAASATEIERLTNQLEKAKGVLRAVFDPEADDGALFRAAKEFLAETDDQREKTR